MSHLEKQSGNEAIRLNFGDELMGCFPTLPKEVTTYLTIFLPRLLAASLENSMSFDLVGSVQRRIVERLDEAGVLFPGSERIIAVQGRFKQLYNEAQTSGVENPLLVKYLPSMKKLATGVDDLDFKVKKRQEAQLTEEDKLRFGEKFLEITQPMNEENFERKASFGPIPTNPSRYGGQLLFCQNGEDVFVVHMGFFPGSQSRAYDRRAGGERVPKKQQGAIPLELENGSLTLLIADPQVEVRRLADPDDFVNQELPEIGWDLAGDLEILLRTVRVALFHHNEKLLQEVTDIDDVYNILFSQNLWQWMENVVQKATEYFSENPPSLKLQRRLAEMMILRMETDPYLTLLIAERIGLLKLFPFFRDQSNISLQQRDWRWILRQREEFLKKKNQTTISPDEFIDLMNSFTFNQAPILDQLPEEYREREVDKDLSIDLKRRCQNFCRQWNSYLKETHGIKIIAAASVAWETAVYTTDKGKYLHDIDFIVYGEDFTPVTIGVINNLRRDINFVHAVNQLLDEVKLLAAANHVSIGWPFEADFIGLPEKNNLPYIGAINNLTESQIRRGLL